jgi:hypothetical protein
MATTFDNQPLPSTAQLTKATATAAAIAGLILSTTVLPAEYGIDPFGAGRALGLLKMTNGAKPAPSVIPAAVGAAATGAPVARSNAPMRSDEMTVTLAPGEGAEIKALIRKGEHFVFHWSTDGAPVKADMHGEPLNAKPNEFTTYWKELQQTSGSGDFTAGFDGIHGWFWRNKGSQPVTIKVQVTGFHEKLYRPS